MDKVLAGLASRTTADIEQNSAMPAIVILGDNNTVCLGDAFVELLKQRMEMLQHQNKQKPPDQGG